MNLTKVISYLIKPRNRDQHRQLIEDAENDLVEVPDEIEVLFDDSKPEWTIDNNFSKKKFVRGTTTRKNLRSPSTRSTGTRATEV